MDASYGDGLLHDDDDNVYAGGVRSFVAYCALDAIVHQDRGCGRR